ncbi:MAG TPA: isocitrate lyase/phosphoenolpyruvate mutase family protein [Candidatus Limnocylindria bacterium]
MIDPDEAVARADRLRGLHHAAEPLILPNAWDVGSALAIERAGATAVATTSSGVAASLGYPDGEAMSAEEMFDVVERIARAVEVPVTVDIEAGYGLEPDAFVDALLASGAAGCNLEDTDRAHDPGALVDLERQAEWLSRVRAAADAAGVPIVINARIDTFLRGSGSLEERVEDGLRRAHAYVAAGADCVYPIWLTETDAIARFVQEVEAPVNVLLRPGAPTLAELRALGVRRISVGGGLAHRAMDATERLARALVGGDDTPFRDMAEG